MILAKNLVSTEYKVAIYPPILNALYVSRLISVYLIIKRKNLRIIRRDSVRVRYFE